MFLVPDYNLKSIYDIDLDELKSKGVKLIMFDLDSTLMVSKSGKYLPETVEWLNRVKQDFKIVVVSNNNRGKYIDGVREISDFDVLGSCAKPGTKIIGKYITSCGLSKDDCAMVGDRPLTDILCGKRLGCMTILVGSINAANEGIPTRFVRWLERLTIKRG
ncbi:MAG: YqeG family HAD IIIA-type phosphatase [Cyanobacteria bacterium RUI128]|nr:YqeG family HAD IIIA-type phosphatase [Cyanobacteria bacterium RUI128]